MIKQTNGTSSPLKSRLSVWLLAVLVILAALLVSISIFGFWLLLKAIGMSNMALIVTGTILLWVGFGMFWLTQDTVKILELAPQKVIVKKLFGSRSFDIESIFYDEFTFDSLYTNKHGLILQMGRETTVTIVHGAYTNSTELISFIRNTCQKRTGIEMQVWTRSLKVFTWMGVSLLSILLLVVSLK